MTVPQYVKECTEDTELENNFRLKCGHAFHLVCICRSLRNNANCPMCNTGNEQEIILNDVQDANEPILNILGAVLVVQKIDEVRKNYKIQMLRRNLNNAIKKYHHFENSLMRKRKFALEHQGLRHFRKTYRHEFEKERKKLQWHFNVLKKEEFDGVLKTADSEEDKRVLQELLHQTFASDYSVYGIYGSQFGPLKFSFWN